MDAVGQQNVSSSPGADRILTIPNVLSMIRLAGVPLFLYLLLGPQADGWALAVLMLSGFTDWADGKLARLLNQMSRLGALLDPFVDRLYVIRRSSRSSCATSSRGGSPRS